MVLNVLKRDIICRILFTVDLTDSQREGPVCIVSAYAKRENETRHLHKSQFQASLDEIDPWHLHTFDHTRSFITTALKLFGTEGSPLEAARIPSKRKRSAPCVRQWLRDKAYGNADVVFTWIL